jgi:phenylpropionate dioxygenase-like ring-hydroxylating dioxygenase large terminal subunit
MTLTSDQTPGQAPGQARSPGPTVQEVLTAEARKQPVPEVLCTESPAFLGLDGVPRERYTSREFLDLEVEKMWRTVWQMACRERDIPNVGDTIVYDIVDDSILLVRVAPDQIKAFHNTCLHRGTQLARGRGNVSSVVCPFHGWTWNLDGSMKSLPCKWDFPQLDQAKLSLPEVACETWDGWVFVNLDPDHGPLADYLGTVVPGHFRHFSFEDRFKAAHVAARVPANWKVVIEAFMEGYHVPLTHPEIVMITGDLNSQYDIYDDHTDRMITLLGVPSPSVGEVDDQTLVETYVVDLLGSDSPTEIPEGRTARDVIADAQRGGLEALYGLDLSGVSNTEALDTIQYTIFPNFIPWAGVGFPVVYRFRPDGRNPDSSIFEMMLMAPCPPGPQPPDAPIHWLQTAYGEEMPDFTEAPELGYFGPVINQDMSNLVRVQRGLHAGRETHVRLSAYQEVRIRHLHLTLMKYLDA